VYFLHASLFTNHSVTVLIKKALGGEEKKRKNRGERKENIPHSNSTAQHRQAGRLTY
jgi:hypothetical protein